MNIICSKFHADISNRSREINISNEHKRRNRAAIFVLAQYVILFAELKCDGHETNTLAETTFGHVIRKRRTILPDVFLSTDLINL